MQRFVSIIIFEGKILKKKNNQLLKHLLTIQRILCKLILSIDDWYKFVYYIYNYSKVYTLYSDFQLF